MRERNEQGQYVPVEPARRFWAKVNKQFSNGCWVWTGCVTTSEQCMGYGQFGYNGKHVLAHRFAYELLKSSIPKGLVLDHLCRNRLCVNPAHLEPVTLRENILRGESFSARYARRATCIHGHILSENNLFHAPHRRCKTCVLSRQKTHRRALKQQARAYLSERKQTPPANEERA